MKSGAKHEPALLYVIAWLVLVVLTGVSTATAFLGLGMYAQIIQFGIAASQAAIIFILFMRLKGPPSLKWLFAGAGFFWLLFLYGLSTTDYATRQGWPSQGWPSQGWHS
jgi:cytochrome c oxidase subunit 4